MKYLRRQLANNIWDRHLRAKIYHEKKVYRKIIRKKHRHYKNKVLNDLLENEKKTPIDFWSTVNNLISKHKSDPSEDIAPDSWINHFKYLFNMDYRKNFEQDERNIELQHLNNGILNKKITVEEVSESIIVLKNGKAFGCDNISNGMLKVSAQFFIDDFAFY